MLCPIFSERKDKLKIMISANIKNISLFDTTSWKDKIFLTFDVDWASDEVLSFVLDIIEKQDVKATFFFTHETILLDRMKNNSNIELGIHPNFNPLLNGDVRYGKDIDEVIDSFMKIVPDAVSVRSHSMTQNTLILDSFTKHGLKYDCNHFIPVSAGIELEPWFLWNKQLIKVPYYWEDDVHCMYDWEWNVKPYLNQEGLKVFDFHPIHVFLNTEHLDRYEKFKESQKHDNLSYHVNTQHYGTYTFLMDLIKVGI